MKLYVTYCCAGKLKGIHPPDALYTSKRVKRFIRQCKVSGLNWAIFSALYALFFPEESKEDYDVTLRTDRNYWIGIAVIKDGRRLPLDQSKQHILQLVDKLRQQGRDQHVEQIVFYGPSPKMMKCYLSVLHYAFDGCSEMHSWDDLAKHVRTKSRIIKVIHKFSSTYIT
jgi:hypothetical protein